MDYSRIYGRHAPTRITKVPRQSHSFGHKVQPIVNKEESHTTTTPSTLPTDSVPAISSRSVTPYQPTIQSIDHSSDQSKVTNQPTVENIYYNDEELKPINSPIVHNINHDDQQLKDPNQSTVQNIDYGHNQIKPTDLLSPTIISPVPTSLDRTNTFDEVKNSDDNPRNWYNRLTPKQKFLFKLTVASLLIIAVAAVTVLPIYFFIISPNSSSESSSANISVSACSTTTCIGQETPYHSSIVTALYPFDGNTNDLSGYNSGTAYGNTLPSATTGYISQSYTFATGSLQYIQIPNFNFAKQSFTLQVWLLPSGALASLDLGIFSQCDIYNNCISFSLRNARIAFVFNSMAASSNILIGSTLILNGYWIHVTVVYDATLFQQRIYVNGRIDALSNGIVNSYRGVISTSAQTTIGRSSSFGYGTTYFNGRIDHFTISVGTARNACQILNDASLVAFYSFESATLINDYSVSYCNGVAFGTTTVTPGRVGQAISFTSNSSYFQALCAPTFRGNELSFTYSLWINPYSNTSGGSIVHISATTNGSLYCYDLLAFSTTGNIVLQFMTSAINVSSSQGPVIPINTWTHIAVVYLYSNGIDLYINGQYSASSGNTGNLNLYTSPVYPMYITLGNVGILGSSVSVSCINGGIPISPGPFPGAIDEFRLYNQALDNQEVCVLANP